MFSPTARGGKNMGRRIAIKWARPGDAPFPRRIAVAALGAEEAFEGFLKVLCDGKPELQKRFREQERWCVAAKAILLRECTARRRRVSAKRRLPASAESREV
jgi:hypothetical protein